MTKEQIINNIIKDKGYKKYLEIGFKDGFSFNKVDLEDKTAVDPFPDIDDDRLKVMTSDEFFKVNTDTWDIIFIDGLHHQAQVRKDIINASKCLSTHGCIVLHDLLPPSEESQIVPRQQKQWVGDCWRAFVGFRNKYPEVLSYTHNHDYGVGVIFPNGVQFKGYFSDTKMTYDEFNERRETLLGVVRG